MGGKINLFLKFLICPFRDMAPEGCTLEESNRNLDEITDLALELQKQTGVKVLWVTCNLFAHPRSVQYTFVQDLVPFHFLFHYFKGMYKVNVMHPMARNVTEETFFGAVIHECLQLWLK